MPYAYAMWGRDGKRVRDCVPLILRIASQRSKRLATTPPRKMPQPLTALAVLAGKPTSHSFTLSFHSSSHCSRHCSRRASRSPPVSTRGHSHDTPRFSSRYSPRRYSLKRASARLRCEILFLSSAPISAYVSSSGFQTVGWKMGSHPKKLPFWRGGTTQPSVRPTKVRVGQPAPRENAMIVCAYAARPAS